VNLKSKYCTVEANYRQTRSNACPVCDSRAIVESVGVGYCAGLMLLMMLKAVCWCVVLISSQRLPTVNRRLTICRQSSLTRLRSTANTSSTSTARSVPGKSPIRSTTTTVRLPLRRMLHWQTKLQHRRTLDPNQLLSICREILVAADKFRWRI